ncbi:endo-1,4-beta-xylanase [Haloferula rosea]|uniref:endo-1,4-beta-xylanase n=1 Tax=Haloferula rosea TaxID=490093 RepID=A0A934V9P8_9BACT|nr:endo-1,4-beta-xylanase [Haloferula rosea]MBK1825468.1 endo-1,4-beta-xylanase [Haloferula rosea]
MAHLLVAGPSIGAEPIQPPEGGKESVAFGPAGKLRVHEKEVGAEGDWKAMEDAPVGKAFHLTFNKGKVKEAKDVQLMVPLKRGVRKGDVMLISFWIRRPGAGGEPGPVSLYLQQGGGRKRHAYMFSAYRAWQQHVKAFESPSDFDPGKGNVGFHLGTAGPEIEIGDLRLINFGTEMKVEDLPESAISYRGREVDADWRQKALERIERIRKGDLTIKVLDVDGEPVKGAKVKVEMQRHAFQFGNTVRSAILGATEDKLPFTKDIDGNQVRVSYEDVEKYRQIVKDYCSAVTFESSLRPHAWKLANGKNPGWQERFRVFTQEAVPWLQEQGIDIRGHYIAWGAIDYNPMEKQFVGDPKGHRKWLWEHMADVLPRTNGFVNEWDTLNHIVAWGKHTYEIEYGGLDIYVDVMKEARRLAPDARHAVNEGKVLPDGYKREPYKRIIRYLNEHGQAPDVVGFMAHFDQTSLTPPEELLQVYDDFAEIAPRLQLSEFDVEVGDDESLQADYYRDVMIASFSHPNFVGIVQWGFWENAHWKPHAALWRADWSLKPVGKVFVDLVRNQWWTRESATTNESGECSIRGFLGSYEITVDYDDQVATAELSLTRDGSSQVIRLK